MAEDMTKLAEKIKGSGKTAYIGPLIGTVEKTFPDFIIRLDNNVTLKKEDRNTIFANSILAGYRRITSLETTGANGVDSDGDRQNTIGYHDGTLIFDDTIKVGDIVIVVPSADHQKYFVIDWAVEM